LHALDLRIDFAHVAGNPSIPAEDFELAKTRCIESFAKTLSRDDNDPLAYGAKGNRIDCAIPVRPDDALTLGTLNNINAISSLDIPASPSAPSSPEMSVLVPTSLAPSAPAVAWENRLTLPSVAGDGTQDDFLLTTTLTPLVSPFVEWAESRWIMPPPNNGLVWRVAYDRDSESAKSMAWREYRPLFAEWVGTDLHGRYMILDDATAKTSSWHKKHDTVGQIGGDPTALKTNPPQKNRVVAAVDGTLGLSPRFDYSTVSLNIDPATDLAYDSLYVVDGTGDGTDSHHHIEFEFSLANPMKNDAGNDVAPSMIFLCVKTFSETVALHPENFTAYPVFNIRHNFIEIPEEDDPTSTDGDLSSTSVITGSFMLMNRTQQYGTGWGTDAIEFYWTGDRSVTIHCLCMYDTEI